MPAAGPEPRSRSRHLLWIVVGVIVVAAVVYFVFFTRTPDPGTQNPNALQPAQSDTTVPTAGTGTAPAPAQ
ncbi:hypothetical protein [Jiella sp. M17.18]|uniref:hypothetical protein n=1 Tax=Jiella sp. M17.18 TaxID=3234247 RepID=UPI0034DE9D18